MNMASLFRRNKEESKSEEIRHVNSASGLSNSDLRKRIRAVQKDDKMDSSEKAKLLQSLMTTSWRRSQEDNKKNNEIARTNSDTFSVCSTGSGIDNGCGDSARSNTMVACSYHDESQGILGCEHYMRGCLIKAPCCSRFFPCRFCHDQHPDSDHTIDRYAIDQVKCMKCGLEQPVAANCNGCGVRFAKYFCESCKFYDNHPDKNIYHCPHCNICRIGKGLGIDYFHCHKCNACMSTTLKDHKCVERSLESNCPVCHEFMFTSTTPVMFLPCGHCMHVGCYEKYTETNYVCPICSKSLGNMDAYFKRIDAVLEQEVMPEQFQGVRSKIFCADCELRSVASFHFLYHKCFHCGSYNTKVLDQISRSTVDPLEVEQQRILEQRKEGANEVIQETRRASNNEEVDMEELQSMDAQLNEEYSMEDVEQKDNEMELE